MAHALDEFLSHPVAVAAGLTREEVIAIRLFTGPMFMKYNAVLRGFPQAVIDKCKARSVPCVLAISVMRLSPS